MIVYLDTSALVKAYVTEKFSASVLSAMADAKAVASHLLAFVEAHATFARLFREGALDETQFDAVKREFTSDWANYLQIGTTQPVIQRAADFCESFALRAYDGVHLAAADYLLKQTDEPILFASFDRRLNQAASILGLSLLRLD